MNLEKIVSEIQSVPRKKPIVAASWLSKPLVGESQCLVEYYVQVRHKIPSNGEFISYQMQHQKFLRERKQLWEAKGYNTSIEKQNTISFTTKKTIDFIGTPDLYVKQLNHIEELKTGKPKDSDVVQLMLYMAAAPYVYGLQEIPSGEVCYRGGSSTTVFPEEITQEFKDQVTELIGILVADQVPKPVPSESDCRFCKLNQCCPVSVIGDDVA